MAHLISNALSSKGFMMFIKCSVASTLNIGDIVQYDSASSTWVALTSPSANPWGVVVSAPVSDETEGSSLYLARVQFAGACLAKASRDIPNDGGSLAVESGGVYVDASGDCGLVAPNAYNQAARSANSLVMIHIR